MLKTDENKNHLILKSADTESAFVQSSWYKIQLKIKSAVFKWADVNISWCYACSPKEWVLLSLYLKLSSIIKTTNKKNPNFYILWV